MAILVCRVAWMPSYRSDDERAVGGGSHVDQGYVPHESLNFLPIGDTYYGFVENRGERLDLTNLKKGAAGETVTGASVVFGAEDPTSKEFLVTGWYSGATVYRNSIERPGDALGRRAHFTTTSATLVVESERCFRLPRANDNPRSSFGGIGQRHIWYGLNTPDASDFRDFLIEYMNSRALMQTPEEAVIESRKRKISETLERRGNYRHFIRRKGYRCEACEWSIEAHEREVWGSSFELHHLEPFSDLEEEESRVVGIDDFAVLCATCHRAIHRTEYVSDVEGFAQAYIGT